MTIIQHNFVCGLEEIAGHAAHNVSHILSIVDPELGDIAGLSAHTPARHVRLRFHDIIEPAEGMVMPTAEDVSTILEFGESNRVHAKTAKGMLIHCHMGISRSSAAMASILAQRNAGSSEDAIFEMLREIRPRAWPNSVIIAHADDLLGKHGAFVSALRRHYAHQLRKEPQMGDWIASLGRQSEVNMASG